jgi:hypothetical protein
VSRDGRGRALDNVFVERLWRSVKYEDIYINDYECAPELAWIPTEGELPNKIPATHSLI